MKYLLLFVTLFLLTISVFAQVHVRGYYRANGTYVQPHMRSSPDGNPYNNYSYPGNTNPYTGKVATGNPDTYLKNYNSSSSSNNSSLSVGSAPSTLSNYPSTDFPANSGSSPNFNSTTTSSYATTIPSSNNLKDNYPTSTASDNFIKHDMNLLMAKKKYLKDAKGNYTGEYLKLIEEDDVMQKYILYDVNNMRNGTLVVYANGQRVLFDVFGHIVSRNKFPHSYKK